jgi:hypothetical protein
MRETGWKALLQGKVSKTLQKMRRAYECEGGTSEAMQLGIAYLWLQEYKAAWEHFSAFNQAYPLHAHCTYDMGGAAKWCMDKPSEAVQQWQMGLQCEFTDWAGGITPALLLYSAAVLREKRFSKSEVKRLLMERTANPRAHSWPGPLAQFVLGQIDEDRLRKEAVEKLEFGTIASQLRCDYYVGLVACARGDRGRFLENARKVASLSAEDYDASPDLFLARLWGVKFFLARHEVGAA